LIEKLFPLNRSITGNGVRETLSILLETIPLKINEVPSGTKVLDWEVPKEWNISDAWVKNSKGEKVIDFKNSNLHVLNYSVPVHKKVTIDELKDHLYTLPDFPDWIPYRTSYYNENWGFCLTHNELKKLDDTEYEIFIDSSLKKGSLTYGEYYIKGALEDEILISTHICHPSLANDNLSGIAVATNLAEQLSKMQLRYSYRFLFIPVTIGSITWLSLNEDKVKNIKYGLVLTLLGDENKFNYKKSRIGDSQIDKIVENHFRDSKIGYEILDFAPYGYDERQYCSPGFNLPVGRLSRSIHGEFPEYHTSADNLNFVKPDKLFESINSIMSIINIIEANKKYLNTKPKGEPQLGKLGLFKKVGGQSDAKEYQMALLWMLNMSDGNNSIVDISIQSGLKFNVLENAATALNKVKLLQEIV